MDRRSVFGSPRHRNAATRPGRQISVSGRRHDHAQGILERMGNIPVRDIPQIITASISASLHAGSSPVLPVSFHFAVVVSRRKLWFGFVFSQFPSQPGISLLPPPCSPTTSYSF